MNRFDGEIVTATTFQIFHVKGPFKASYDVGDEVYCPLGIGIITELDKETGNCKIKVGRKDADQSK